jgi:hypothetical protein
MIVLDDHAHTHGTNAIRVRQHWCSQVANTAWALAHLPPDCVPSPEPQQPLWTALAKRCKVSGVGRGPGVKTE